MGSSKTLAMASARPSRTSVKVTGPACEDTGGDTHQGVACTVEHNEHSGA